MANLQQTLKERAAMYGDFRDHARVSSVLRTVIVAEWSRRGLTMEGQEVILEGLLMICHKLARIATGDPLYADSWHDIAGYATIVEERLPKADTLQEAAPHGYDHDTGAQQHGVFIYPDPYPDQSRATPQSAGPGDVASTGVGPGSSQDLLRPQAGYGRGATSDRAIPSYDRGGECGCPTCCERRQRVGALGGERLDRC